MKTDASVGVAHVTSIASSLRFLLMNQLLSLKKEGYEVSGISSPDEGVWALESAGIRHIPLPITRKISPIADIRALFELYRVMRNERFTIVHTHNTKPGLLGQLAARMARVPIVVNTLHGFYFHENMDRAWRRFYITLEKMAARCSDTILSQNSEDIEVAISEGISSPQRIKYLGNGIDLEEFSPTRFSIVELESRKRQLGFEKDQPVVGFVGRLAARRKGFLDFVRAGQYIAEQEPDVRFLIIGEPDQGQADAVEPSVAQEHGIADRCIFLGSRPNGELPLLYLTMSVVVLPSLFEGIPRVVMEACAMGIPVVVTDVKGNREAVEDKRNGLLVPLGNVAELAKGILYVLRNKEWAKKMGEEGRKMALERFDENKVFERVKAEYARLLKSKGIVPFHFQEPRPS